MNTVYLGQFSEACVFYKALAFISGIRKEYKNTLSVPIVEECYTKSIDPIQLNKCRDKEYM